METTTRLAWHRDSQGQWAHDVDQMLAVYVRREPSASSYTYRVTWCDLVTVGDLTVADVAKPMQFLDLTDTQRVAKAVAEEFIAAGWESVDGKSRATRAILAAYAR